MEREPLIDELNKTNHTPFFILQFFIIFNFLTYNIMYSCPLIFDTYWYDNYGLPTTDENQESESNHFNRGLILTFIMSYLLFWLMVSIIRIIKTDPGSPHASSAWSQMTENKINNYLEMEVELMRVKKKY